MSAVRSGATAAGSERHHSHLATFGMAANRNGRILSRTAVSGSSACTIPWYLRYLHEFCHTSKLVLAEMCARPVTEEFLVAVL